MRGGYGSADGPGTRQVPGPSSRPADLVRRTLEEHSAFCPPAAAPSRRGGGADNDEPVVPPAPAQTPTVRPAAVTVAPRRPAGPGPAGQPWWIGALAGVTAAGIALAVAECVAIVTGP